SRFVLCCYHHFSTGSLNEDGDPIALAMEFLFKSVDRHDHEIILGLAEGAADRSSYANHLILVSFRADRFADGIHVGKEFRGNLGTDKDNFLAMVVVRLGDEAALGDTDAAYISIVSGDTHYVRAGQLFVAAADIHVMVVEGGDGLGGLHVVAEALVVIHGDERALLGFDPGVVARDDAEAVDNENVCAEIGDAVRDVEVHAGDEAHYDDENRDGQNDT